MPSGQIFFEAEDSETIVSSGNYNPVLTNILNISSSSASTFQYLRVGNVVNFSGKIELTLSSTGSFSLGLSLPVVGSVFTEEGQVAGVGSGVTSSPAASDNLYVKAAVGQVIAHVNGNDNDQSSHSHYIVGTYSILP